MTPLPGQEKTWVNPAAVATAAMWAPLLAGWSLPPPEHIVLLYIPLTYKPTLYIYIYIYIGLLVGFVFAMYMCDQTRLSTILDAYCRVFAYT